MAYSLTWLADVLRAGGLKVQEVDGWQTRGRGEVGPIQGILCHHTAGAATGNMPTLNLLVNGRPDLAGPLAQLGLARDGTYYIIAAGRANHAGAGNWKGITTGNTSLIGIEAENTGLANDTPWPDAQMDAFHQGVAALLGHIGKPADYCAGHKEYALPKGRKIDPNFDMVPFRAAVAAIMSGTAPASGPSSSSSSSPSTTSPSTAPGTSPAPSTPGPDNRPILRRGSTGDPVKEVQTKVGVPADGVFGPATEAAVMTFQTAHGLTADGVVGAGTWAALATV